MADKMVDSKTLAKTLNCSPETVRRMAREREVPRVKVGRVYRFDLAAVVLSLSLSGDSQGNQGRK
jgi:excisionase family DNA binding protein